MSPRPAVSRLGAEGSGDLAGGSDDSATIRMLLELQEQGEGLENGDRRRRGVARANHATRAAADPAGADAGLQAVATSGSGNSTPARGGTGSPLPAALGVVGGDAASLSRAAMTWMQPGLGTGSADRLPSAAIERDEEAVRSLIPASLLRWVRENRELVLLASVVLVALIAAGSGASKKR